MISTILSFGFLAGQSLGLAVGFVAGLFCPGILRRVRGLFQKAKAEEVKFVAGVGAVDSKVKAELSAVAKKLQ